MANLWQPSLVRVTDENGAPVSGAKMYFYSTGSTTPLTYYLDAAGLSAGPNPQTSDGSGLFPAAFLSATDSYRIKCTNADGSSTYYDVDHVILSDDGGGSGYTDEQARDAIGAALREGPNIDITVSDGSDTITIGLDTSDLSAFKLTESFVVACSDQTTALTAGSAKMTFRIPYAFTLTAVRAGLKTAQTSGSIFTVDINESGTSILSTKLTIDNTEKTSTTAATPVVISDASLADDAELTFDIDQVGDGTAIGLVVTLIGHRT